MKSALTVHIMTAALTPGDAIGNYILTLRRLLTEFGCHVRLYADYTSPDYPAPAAHSRVYQSTGRAVLWFHYSIGAENIARVRDSQDYRLMDFHGVSPARLFAGYDPYLEKLCREGQDLLPQLRDQFEMCVVHSEYSRQVLTEAGYPRIEKLPLVVGTDRFAKAEDEPLAAWASRIHYLLFVGRVVPQKDIAAQLPIMAELIKHEPDAALIIVGRRDLAPGYQREIDRAIDQFGLAKRVMLIGPVNDTRLLATLYRHARFTLVTSEWESFCVPVVESMTCGTPGVTHAVAPVPEIMGAGGIVIDKRDPRAAAQCIAALWGDSPQRDRLAAAARSQAQGFTADVLRRELLAMFKRVFV